MLDFRVWYSNPWVLVNLVHAYWDYARKGNIKQYTVHESATLWLAELGCGETNQLYGKFARSNEL